MCTELGLNMCTRTGIRYVYRTGIKHVHLGVQGACPQQAVTGTGGMARACEGRAVGAGLKLVYILKDYGLMADKFAFYLTKQFTRSSPTPSSFPIFPQTTTKLISIVL